MPCRESHTFIHFVIILTRDRSDGRVRSVFEQKRRDLGLVGRDGVGERRHA